MSVKSDSHSLFGGSVWSCLLTRWSGSGRLIAVGDLNDVTAEGALHAHPSHQVGHQALAGVLPTVEVAAALCALLWRENCEEHADTATLANKVLLFVTGRPFRQEILIGLRVIARLESSAG
jgi:hypothetical protein